MSYTSLASTVHDALIVSAVSEMKRQGMTSTRASHIAGYNQPDLIGGFIPDVTAIFQGQLCIAECESRDGLAQTHTADQWRAFFSHATQNGGYFIVVVSEADKVTAQWLMRQIAGDSSRAILWTF